MYEKAPKEGNLYCDLDTPNAMWYMKYSLTEAQFVQFLNCLSRKQQQSHVMSDISSDTIDQYYVMTNTEKDRAAAIICRCNGNVWKCLRKPISVGRPEGRVFIPEHGTGVLDENGYHTNPGYIHMDLRVFGAHTKNDKRYHGGLRVGF
ncbi:MAG: hypothetical protein PHY47_16335 [Lachnospiraceae bacterium]|nr:hypothetical protein [Lachnospiraceae bacterium]